MLKKIVLTHTQNFEDVTRYLDRHGYENCMSVDDGKEVDIILFDTKEKTYKDFTYNVLNKDLTLIKYRTVLLEDLKNPDDRVLTLKNGDYEYFEYRNFRIETFVDIAYDNEQPIIEYGIIYPTHPKIQKEYLNSTSDLRVFCSDYLCDMCNFLGYNWYTDYYSSLNYEETKLNSYTSCVEFIDKLIDLVSDIENRYCEKINKGINYAN